MNFSKASRFLRAALNGNTQEYAPRGEMYKMLNKQPKGRFDESTTGKYVYQMANALSYCHSKKVRDCFGCTYNFNSISF